MLFVRIFGDLAVHLGQIHIDTWSTYGSRKRIRKDADPGIAEVRDARERLARDNIVEIQKWFRHKSIDSTKRYIDEMGDELKANERITLLRAEKYL